MSPYSTTETEDIILKEYDEKTRAQGIVIRLPKYIPSPADQMRMYQLALEKLHREANIRRRICLKEGNARDYILIDTLEKEAETKLLSQFFPESGQK